LQGVGEFKLINVVDFNEIKFFSHSMLVEKSTLKNHFTLIKKLDKCGPRSKSKAQYKLQYKMVEIKTDFSSVIWEEVGIVSLV
jgi:hypothetical protein